MDQADMQLAKTFVRDRGLDIKEDGVSYIIKDAKTNLFTRFAGIGQLFDAYQELVINIRINGKGNQRPN